MNAPARVSGALALLLAAGLASGLNGQQAERPAPAQFRGGANVVRVDMHAMREGVPVQDLRVDEIELLEDGVPQSIQSFEHVVIRPIGPQALRSDPGTVEESRTGTGNPRARIFVLFLDIPHVSMEGGRQIREPLIRLIDRILGPDDLVGIMTPEMAAADVVLARKTDVMERGLRSRWPWGERHDSQRNERERMYEACYPLTRDEAAAGKVVSDYADALMHRRRERTTLDALQRLVVHLREAREERKAILTITEGWVLFQPDDRLMQLRQRDTDSQDPIPTGAPVSVGPDGRLTTRDPRYNLKRSDCDGDRQELAAMDNERNLRTLVDEANRANASFYVVDPRGLAAWDAPMGPSRPPSPVGDNRNLQNRRDAVRTLAEGTDGMAVLDSNDLDAGLKRISDDLSSYYLLGYSSTNTKLDGRFRRITVKVKRPGVDVRARHGYRAATEEEVAAATAAAGAAAPAGEPVSAVDAALADLARARPDTPFRINVVPQIDAGGVSRVWVAGELRGAAASAARTAAGQVEIQISGAATGTAQVALPAGQQAFLTSITLDKPVAAGTVDVRARLNGMSVVPLTDNVRVDAAGVPRALLFRRGPFTGNRLQPAGDPQFSRTERVRLELPVAPGVTPAPGRILDRAGNPLAVPVTMGERTDDATGQRWITADVILAPLTLGDYAIEVGVTTGASTTERFVTAIRVTR